LVRPSGPEDVWASNERFLQRHLVLPPDAKTLRMILDLRYGLVPDPAPGVQIDWLDAQGAFMYSVPLGIIYDSRAAAVYALESVPAGADSLALVIRPNAGSLITLSKGELLFTPKTGASGT